MVRNILRQATFAAAVALALALVWLTGATLLIWDGLRGPGPARRRHRSFTTPSPVPHIPHGS